MKKLAIFDLDGTLLNTIEDLGKAANHALAQKGLPIHNMASYPFLVGNGVKNLLLRAVPEESRTDSAISDILKIFKEYYNEHNCDFTMPYDGIKELLSELSQLGVKIAVASNKYQQATEKIVQHFFPETDFVTINGQQEGIPVKPDPSIVFDILAKAGVTKDETVFIGDSGVDMDTARRACIDSIGVTWGFRPEKELIEHYADKIVYKPSEILEIIKNYSSKLVD